MPNTTDGPADLSPAAEAAATATDAQPVPAVDPATLAPGERVNAAIERTSTTEALADHWTGLLASRTPGPRAAGSVCDVPEGFSLVEALRASSWQPFEHPAVKAPAVAFWTDDLQGSLGIVKLAKLHPATLVTLRDAHATGFLSAELYGTRGDREGVCMILGPTEGGEVVYTFHPGAPVKPSTVKATDELNGQQITAARAIELGLETAKLR